MISTILTCAKCASQRLQKNGSSRGNAKYRCYDCGHQAVFAPAAPRRAAQYTQVVKLLGERNSQRSVVRVTGVARMTIARWIKKVAAEVVEPEVVEPKVVEPKVVEPEVVEPEVVEPEGAGPEGAGPEGAVLEMDEMWTFVGKRKRKVWLWLAVERASRRIVAWVLGCRGAATGQRLFHSLPARYQTNTTYYTDEWAAYTTVLPAHAHQPSAKGSGRTSIVEALNCSLRHRCGVLVRKSCSFSKSLTMYHARIKICIDNHNRKITTVWTTADDFMMEVLKNA